MRIASLQFITYAINAVDFLAVLSAAGVLVAYQYPVCDWLSVTADPLPVPFAFALGTLMMIVGALVRATCYKYLGRHFTFQISIRKNHKLVTSGPYSVVRHPGYTGYWIYMVGVAVSQLGPGSLYAELGLWRTALGFVVGAAQFALMAHISLMFIQRMPSEDSALMNEFGDEWFAWAKRTPCRIIPCVY